MRTFHRATPKIIILLCISVLTALLIGCTPKAAPASGDTENTTAAITANVALFASDGTKREQAMSELLDGRPIYLKFWASWCQSCMKEMPHLENIHQRLGNSIQVIGVNIGINETDKEIHATIEEFGLSMPTVVDSHGELKKKFNFRGTPYHLVLNPQGDVLYAAYKASDTLDELLAELAADGEYDHETKAKRTDVTSSSPKQPVPAWMQSDTITAILFTAEWCEWYLADTRPEMAQTCIDVQRRFNALEQRHSDIEWRTLLSPLWTGPEEVAAYKAKHNVQHSIGEDIDNALFEHFHITQFPTLVFVDGASTLARFEGKEILADELEEFLDEVPED